MRTSKISSGNSGYHVWILAFAMSLLILIALSKSWFYDHASATASEDLQYFSVIVPSKGRDYPPVLAYWICGTSGDGKRMLRLLKAIYHPRNQYLLQLDAESSDYERAELVVSVQSEVCFKHSVMLMLLEKVMLSTKWDPLLLLPYSTLLRCFLS